MEAVSRAWMARAGWPGQGGWGGGLDGLDGGLNGGLDGGYLDGDSRAGIWRAGWRAALDGGEAVGLGWRGGWMEGGRGACRFGAGWRGLLNGRGWTDGGP